MAGYWGAIKEALVHNPFGAPTGVLDVLCYLCTKDAREKLIADARRAAEGERSPSYSLLLKIECGCETKIQRDTPRTLPAFVPLDLCDTGDPALAGCSAEELEAALSRVLHALSVAEVGGYCQGRCVLTRHG